LTCVRADVPMASLMRLARLLLPCLLAVTAPSFALQLGPPPAYTIPPSLQIPPGTKIPSDAQLLASRARIGRIQIDVVNVFDLSDPAENNWLYRVADRLHIPTRKAAIQALLLFRSGERYSPELIKETERNIRQNVGFLREPLIRPYRYHDGVVDIQVIVHDVWSLEPGISYSRYGGVNAWGFDFKDGNFLGTGKSFEVGHTETVDRRSDYFNWIDPNVIGTRWTDMVQYQKNSDGTVWGVALAYPFYSLETPLDGGIDAGNSHSVVTRYRLGDIYDYYDNDWRTGDVFFGDSLLINDRWTERLLLGWRVDDSEFYNAPGRQLLAPLPQNRNLSYPFARLQWTRNDYQTITNLNQIALTEDLHMGLDAQLGVGLSTPVFGGDRDSVIVDSELADAYALGTQQRQLVFWSARASARFEEGAMHDGIVNGSAQYYLVTTDHTRFFSSLTADVGHHLDGDHYFDLGGDDGLRGYPLRFQNGNQLALWTVEERVYTNWYPFSLFNVGAAAFYDMGRTWGSPLVATPDLGLLKDVGVGLRLGNARSSFGDVVHIDLAFPLDRYYHISGLQFLVTTEASY
jgi:outer membrane protein assembly factor BamA